MRMQTKIQHWVPLSALLLTLLFVGCAQQKKVAVTEPARATAKPATEVLRPEGMTIVEQALRQQPDFLTAQAQRVKFTIDYSEREISAGGSITLIRDSILILSVQPVLNIELFRAEITPTEIVVLDKMNKRYVRTTYAELQKKTGLPITFSDIQALAMDRMFVLGREASCLSGEEAQQSSKNAQTVVTLRDGKLDYSFTLDEQTLALVQTKVAFVNNTGRIALTYSGHSNQSGVLFPSNALLALSSRYLSGKVNIALPAVTINGVVNANRAKTTNLNRVSLDTMIKGK